MKDITSEINNIIKCNKEKFVLFEGYAKTNAMIKDRIPEANFSAIKMLLDKKKSIITSIEILDDRIVKSVYEIKRISGVNSLSELKIENSALLSELKSVSFRALKLMADTKTIDEDLTAQIEQKFAEIGNKRDTISRNRLYYYTDDFFKYGN